MANADNAPSVNLRRLWYRAFRRHGHLCRWYAADSDSQGGIYCRVCGYDIDAHRLQRRPFNRGVMLTRKVEK